MLDTNNQKFEDDCIQNFQLDTMYIKMANFFILWVAVSKQTIGHTEMLKVTRCIIPLFKIVDSSNLICKEVA